MRAVTWFRRGQKGKARDFNCHNVIGLWSARPLFVVVRSGAVVSFALDRGDGGQPHLRSQLALDGKTGEVVRWEPASNNTLGRRLRVWLRFAHTGEVYGPVGQTVVGPDSLGGAFLVYTGLPLARRRFYSWRGGRAREPRAENGA